VPRSPAAAASVPAATAGRPGRQNLVSSRRARVCTRGARVPGRGSRQSRASRARSRTCPTEPRTPAVSSHHAARASPDVAVAPRHAPSAHPGTIAPFPIASTPFHVMATTFPDTAGPCHVIWLTPRHGHVVFSRTGPPLRALPSCGRRDRPCVPPCHLPRVRAPWPASTLAVENPDLRIRTFPIFFATEMDPAKKMERFFRFALHAARNIAL